MCAVQRQITCAHFWAECVRRSARFCKPLLEVEERVRVTLTLTLTLAAPSEVRGHRCHQSAAFVCLKTRLIRSCSLVGFLKRLMDARSGLHVSIDEQRWRDPASTRMYTWIDLCR